MTVTTFDVDVVGGVLMFVKVKENVFPETRFEEKTVAAETDVPMISHDIGVTNEPETFVQTVESESIGE